MIKLKKGVEVGKIIAGRVKDYPVWTKEPKRMPKKKPTCWILCPDFRAKPPKVMNNAEREKTYSFTISISSETREDRDAALDHMIRCGQEEIEAGNKRFWLYAVNHKKINKGLFLAKLTYIFRVKQIPE